MYENLNYEALKELPSEQKKNALIELKERYPHYKEMAEKIGGTPTALSNLYLRIVEGKKFGRKKKAIMEPIISEAPILSEVKQKRTRRKRARADDPQMFPSVIEQPEIIIKSSKATEAASKSTASFTIRLETEETGNEASERISGIIGSFLKDKKYKINLRVEEV